MKLHCSGLMGVVFFLGLPGLAFAGGATISSAQDGDWSSTSTWIGGVVPDTSGNTAASVRHTVGVTTSGQGANVIVIGDGANPGTVNVSAGSLTSNNAINIADINAGTLNITGGTVTAQKINVGFSSTGAMNVSGGSINLTPPGGAALDIGTGGGSGTLRVTGASASFSLSAGGAGQGINIGDNGTLIIEPTANGSAGLSKLAVSAGSVNLGADSTQTLDDSSYTPSVGDTWDVISSPDTIVGTFGTLSAPTGYTIIQSTVAARGVNPEKIVIEVTAVPTPVTWVDFGFLFAEDGSELNPWNTLLEGLQNVSAGGTINIKGDRGTPFTTEKPTINQDVTLQAPSGTVTIGVPFRNSASRSGFVSRKSKGK